MSDSLTIPESFPPGGLSTNSMDLCPSFAAAVANGYSAASAVYPTANRALFYPVFCQEPFTARFMGIANGTAVAGNVDVGIYDVLGNRLVSSGSVAQAGTSTVQTFNIADTDIPMGWYFLAVACSSTTAQFMRMSAANQLLRAHCVMQMDTALPLPATATFAALASSYHVSITASAFAAF